MAFQVGAFQSNAFQQKPPIVIVTTLKTVQPYGVVSAKRKR